MRQEIQRRTPIVIEKSQHFGYKYAIHVDIQIIPHETVKSKLDANSISYEKNQLCEMILHFCRRVNLFCTSTLQTDFFFSYPLHNSSFQLTNSTFFRNDWPEYLDFQINSAT